MHPTWLLYPRGWVLYPRRLLAFAGDPSRGGIRTGAIHYLFTYRLVESLWSSLTLISEFYDTLGETLATSLVTPTIAGLEAAELLLHAILGVLSQFTSLRGVDELL